MEGFLSDQSPVSAIQGSVANYSSSYGGFLYRSPNSPPPSPPPSIPSDLIHLFFSAHPHRFPSASLSSSLQLRQPPLLPLPRSATFPAPPTVIGSRRQHAKRKGKAVAAARKEDQRMKMKDEEKPAMLKGGKKSAEGKTIEGEEEMHVESVYSLSPPPSSLPLPRFSLVRPRKAGGASGGVVEVSCIEEAVAAAGGVCASGTDDPLRI